MQGTVKLFCESLARQIEQYRALLEITRRERRCLGNKDLEGMRTIIKEKEAVYDSLCPNWKIEGFDNCSDFNGWLLWDPRNIYTPSALESETQ